MKTIRIALAVVLLSSCAAFEARSGEITVQPTNTNFGMVSVSGPPASNQVMLLNIGSTTTVNGVAPSGPSCNGFGLIGPPFPLLLGNNQSVFYQVSFDPVTRGPANCVFMLQDNDPNLDVIELVGVGTAPLLGLISPPFPQALGFADQPWDGGQAETLYVEVQNGGNEAITAGHLLANLSTGTDFAVGMPQFPIAPNAHALVPVYFDPTSEGAKNDVLFLDLDNDLPGENGFGVNLSGQGTANVGVAPLARPIGLRLVGPNPVTDQTRFAFDLPAAGRVKLGLYSMSGRLVQPLLDRVEEAGPHTWSWSQAAAGALPSGMYLVRFSFEGRAMGASRVVLVR